MKGHHDRDGKFVVDHHRLVRVNSDTLRPGSREANLAHELYSSRMNNRGRHSAVLMRMSQAPPKAAVFPEVVHYKLKDLTLPEDHYVRPKTSRTPKSISSKFPQYINTHSSKQMEAQKLFVTNALARLSKEKQLFTTARRDIEHMISYNGSLECASVVQGRFSADNNVELIRWDKMYIVPPKKGGKARPQSTSSSSLLASASSSSSLSKGTVPRKLPCVASTYADTTSITAVNSSTSTSTAAAPVVATTTSVFVPEKAAAVHLRPTLTIDTSDGFDDDEGSSVEYL